MRIFILLVLLCKIFCKRTSQHKGIQEKCWAFKHIVNRCHGWKFVRKSMKAAASSCRPNTETNVQLCKWQIPRRKREFRTTTTTHSDWKLYSYFSTHFTQKLIFCWTHQKWSKCITKVVVPPLLTIIIISVSVMSLLGISFSAATFIDICQRYYTSFWDSSNTVA